MKKLLILGCILCICAVGGAETIKKIDDNKVSITYTSSRTEEVNIDDVMKHRQRMIESIEEIDKFLVSSIDIGVGKDIDWDSIEPVGNTGINWTDVRATVDKKVDWDKIVVSK